MRVYWSCGLAVGPPEWQGTDTYECPECPEEGEIEVTDEEFHSGDIELVTCPRCGQYLEDSIHYDPEPPLHGPPTRYNRLHLEPLL